MMPIGRVATLLATEDRIGRERRRDPACEFFSPGRVEIFWLFERERFCTFKPAETF